MLIRFGTIRPLVVFVFVLIALAHSNPTYAEARIRAAGGAAYFDGVNDYIRASMIGSNNQIYGHWHGSEVSLSVWFKPGSANLKEEHIAGFPFDMGPRIFLSRGVDKDGKAHRIIRFSTPVSDMSPDGVCLQSNSTHFNGTERVAPLPTLDGSEWVHAALSWDHSYFLDEGGGGLVYTSLNGQYVEYCRFYGNNILNSIFYEYFHIGIQDDMNTESAESFEGWVDEVRMHSCFLPLEQVRDMMHRPLNEIEKEHLTIHINFDGSLSMRKLFLFLFLFSCFLVCVCVCVCVCIGVVFWCLLFSPLTHVCTLL